MRDLTLKQVAKQIKKLFPDRTTRISTYIWNYSHSHNNILEKEIYVSGLEPSHYHGESFREILEKIERQKQSLASAPECHARQPE